MNKKILLGLPVGGIALAAAAYAGTAWYAGAQIEQQIHAGIGSMQEASPLVKVTDIKVDRGVFRTTHEMAIGFNSDCLDAGLAAKKPELEKELDKLKFRLRHTITHGPLDFTGGIRPMLAAYEGRVLFDEKTAQELRKVMGDAPALSWNGTLQFDGGYQFTMHSPGFRVDKDGTKAEWAGVQGEGSGNIRDASYKISVRAPRLAINALASASGESGDALAENMHISAEGRIGKTKIGIGTAAFSIDKLQFTDSDNSAPLEISGLVYAADIKEAGEFVDMQGAYRIGSVQFGDQQKKYGPVVLDLGLEHLHAPSVLAFSTSINKVMCARPDQKEVLTQEAIEHWKQLAASLLENRPVLHLRQISFAAPEGEMNFSGRIGIDGFKPAMFDDPQAAMIALPEIVQIEFSGRASEKLLMSSFRDITADRTRNQLQRSGADNVPPEELKLLQDSAEQGARAQLELAVAQNFVKQEGDQLTVSFGFSKGQATLNGAPLDLPFLPKSKTAIIADDAVPPISSSATAQ